MRISVLVVAALGAVVLVGSLRGHVLAAEPGAIAAQCPTYGAHLRSAAEAVKRGDRAAAVIALRAAQAALRACGRAETGSTRLHANCSSTPPRGAHV